MRSGRAEGWYVRPDVGFSEPALRMPVVADMRVRMGKNTTVLDLGCGVGVYGEMLRGNLGRAVTLIGLDAFEPYLSTARVRRFYDVRLRADLFDVVEGRLPLRADCVLCMDVVEHQEPDRARALLAWLFARPLAYISTPLFWMPQPALEGNEHERHRCFFREEELVGMGWRRVERVRIRQDGWVGAYCNVA